MFKFLRFLKYNTAPERIEAKCRSLVMLGTNAAFKMFKDGEARKHFKFADVNQTEQDRFFNEIVVTNIVMLMLILDQQIAESSDPERKEYLRAVREEVPKFFHGFLKKIGIPDEYLGIWKKLVDLRYNEYEDESLKWRKTIMNVDYDTALNKGVMIFQAAAFGLYHHLRRGKVNKKDEFFIYIQKYLLPVYKGLIKKIGR